MDGSSQIGPSTKVDGNVITKCVKVWILERREKN